MGIIYTGENDARLRELTIIRAIAALPVAGRFRVIDFLVSSMVNGGMKNIGVIMQKNYHSLMDRKRMGSSRKKQRPSHSSSFSDQRKRGPLSRRSGCTAFQYRLS